MGIRERQQVHISKVLEAAGVSVFDRRWWTDRYIYNSYPMRASRKFRYPSTEGAQSPPLFTQYNRARLNTHSWVLYSTHA